MLIALVMLGMVAVSSQEREVPAPTVAVLEFRSGAVEPDTLNVLSDAARSAVRAALPGETFLVLTRKATLALLNSRGCTSAGIQCELATGLHHADFVISGEVHKVGTHLAMSINLRETREGRVLAEDNFRAKSVDGVLAGVQPLITKLIQKSGIGIRESLSKSDILMTIKRNHGDVLHCTVNQRRKDPHKAEGIMLMTWIVQKDGSTSDVAVVQDAFKGTDIGACMTRSIRRWKFDVYRGETMRPINFPFKLDNFSSK